MLVGANPVEDDGLMPCCGGGAFPTGCMSSIEIFGKRCRTSLNMIVSNKVSMIYAIVPLISFPGVVGLYRIAHQQEFSQIWQVLLCKCIQRSKFCNVVILNREILDTRKDISKTLYWLQTPKTISGKWDGNDLFTLFSQWHPLPSSWLLTLSPYRSFAALSNLEMTSPMPCFVSGSSSKLRKPFWGSHRSCKNSSSTRDRPPVPPPCLDCVFLGALPPSSSLLIFSYMTIITSQ